MNSTQAFLHTQAVIELPYKKTGIVLPTTDNTWCNNVKVINAANPDKLVPYAEQAKLFFAQFGGYTITEQRGGWSDNGVLVEENSQYIWAYCNPDTDQLTYLIMLAQSIKAAFGQDAILIVIDGIPYLV